MKRVLLGLVALLVLIVAVAFARYETLAPCRILRHDFAARMEREAGPLGAATAALGMDIVTRLEKSTPGDCVRAWWELQTDGPQAAMRELAPAR